MALDWDLLVSYLRDHNMERYGLCFVIDYYGLAFITRRRKRDYLAGCYELPQGIIQDNESVKKASQRILKDAYEVDLEKIDRYLGVFDYISGHGCRTQMFCFAVTVKDVFKIKVKRNDHGTWLQAPELACWPIITHFRDFLVNFWIGEGFDPNLSRFLIEQAKREDIWRFKVRAIATKKSEILLLKRARRHRVLPLYYEFPGKEITHNQDIDSALVACMTEQTGYAPKDIITFIGYYDYKSEATRGLVRELLYHVVAQDKPVKLSEHAYSAWVNEVRPSKLLLTPCAEEGLKMIAKRMRVDSPLEIEMPPTVYANPEQSVDEMENRYLDAMALLEQKGEIVDFEALKGKPLVKAAFSPDVQKKLGLD
jgi:ADP-ribose pyrophosphatase YjhB (NUDIX family)